MTDASNTELAATDRHTYIQFLMALYLEGGGSAKSVLIRPLDQRLLEFITARHALHRPLSMMQILNSQELLYLGPSSISRKVDGLIKKGFVRVVSDVADRRIKFVEPTDKTMAYFDALNMLMPV